MGSAKGLALQRDLSGPRAWASPGCGTIHDRDENAGTNLVRPPASQAGARSDGKTALVRRVVVNRVNHPGRVTA